jgi:hypothetical protein
MLLWLELCFRKFLFSKVPRNSWTVSMWCSGLTMSLKKIGPTILQQYMAHYTKITTRWRDVPWAEWGFSITTYEYSESSHNLEDVTVLHPRKKKDTSNMKGSSSTSVSNNTEMPLYFKPTYRCYPTGIMSTDVHKFPLCFPAASYYKPQLQPKDHC